MSEIKPKVRVGVVIYPGLQCRVEVTDACGEALPTWISPALHASVVEKYPTLTTANEAAEGVIRYLEGIGAEVLDAEEGI